jgi:hypothetical protein
VSSPRLAAVPQTTPEMTALRKAGRKYARAQAARDQTFAELQDAIRAARAAGHSPTNEIIPAAGVARQTVFDALKRAPDGGPPLEDRPEVVSYP